ncbi:hypothetical protein AB1E18_007250 [Capra hircus]
MQARPERLPSGSPWAGLAAVSPQRGSLGAAPAPQPSRAVWSLVRPTARASPGPYRVKECHISIFAPEIRVYLLGHMDVYQPLHFRCVSCD